MLWIKHSFPEWSLSHSVPLSTLPSSLPQQCRLIIKLITHTRPCGSARWISCRMPEYWGHYALLRGGDENYFPLFYVLQRVLRLLQTNNPVQGREDVPLGLDVLSSLFCPQWMRCLTSWPPGGVGEGSTHTTVLRAGRNMSREVMPAIDSSTGLENWLQILSLQGHWFPIFHLLCSRHHAGRICQPQPWTLSWAVLRHLGISGIWIVKKYIYQKEKKSLSPSPKPQESRHWRAAPLHLQWASRQSPHEQ